MALIKITKKQQWHGATVIDGVYGKNHNFQAYVFGKPSKYGYRNGHVSKLFVRKDGSGLVAFYDRGWAKKPSKKDSAMIQRLFKYLNDYAKKKLK